MSLISVRERRPGLKRRRGASLVFMVFLMVIVLGAVVCSIEVGRIYLLRSQIQTAVDSAALAASIKLAEDNTATDEAAEVAREFVQRNRVGNGVTVPEDAITVEIGHWNADTQVFATSANMVNAVRVSARQEDEPYYFARIFGRNTFAAPASAVATGSGGPLDIMMVLDLSGSMNSQGRIEALRNAAPEFVTVIEEAGGSDQIGVMTYGAEHDDFDYDEHATTPYMDGIYNVSDPGDAWVAVVESHLTDNFADVENSALDSSNLVGAKYASLTPIGAAIRDASYYLNNSVFAREAANGLTVRKVIVLMSDGHANRPAGNGPGYARSMANYADSVDVTVYTISLGNSADQDLMEDVAERTGGKHFDATGSGEAELTEVLTDAFREIGAALKRPQLVN